MKKRFNLIVKLMMAAVTVCGVHAAQAADFDQGRPRSAINPFNVNKYDLAMLGDIEMWSRPPETGLPDGWVECLGQPLEWEKYPAFKKEVGSRWNSYWDGLDGYRLANPQEFFRAPKSAGRSVMFATGEDTVATRYSGDGRMRLGAGFGAAQMPTHWHGLTQWPNRPVSMPAPSWTLPLVYHPPLEQGDSKPAKYCTAGTDKTGSNQPHENIHPAVVIRMVCKLKNRAGLEARVLGGRGEQEALAEPRLNRRHKVAAFSRNAGSQL